jgi:fumarate reductase flavoprotein subunit
MKSEAINRGCSKTSRALNQLRILLLFLLFAFTACDTGTNPSGNPEAIYSAGSYTGRADGYGGIITVSVVFSTDSITKITVDSHKESQNREAIAKALELIPQAIMDGQTLVVDVITGATRTSSGIIKAVEKCALEAGGKNAVEKLKESSENPA